MKFKKGQSGNPHGRPKGAKNKTTEYLYRQVSSLIENNWARLQADIESLEPKERVRFIASLLTFVLPKPKPIEEKNDEGAGCGITLIVDQETKDLLEACCEC